MICTRGTNMRTNQRPGRQPTLKGELKRFGYEFCLVFALLMLMAQTFPVFAGTFNGWTPVCSQAGLVLAETPSKDTTPSPECSRCSLCITNHTAFGGLPVKSVGLGRVGGENHTVEPAFWANNLVLPDHILPFSGAPPPVIQVEIMQHSFFVPVSFTPTNYTAKPEFTSWL